MTPSSPKKVLFVHPSDDYDGSSTSIMTLIRHLDPARDRASVLIAHPLAHRFSRASVPWASPRSIIGKERLDGIR